MIYLINKFIIKYYCQVNYFIVRFLNKYLTINKIYYKIINSCYNNNLPLLINLNLNPNKIY
jgi:hypothetical protein